MNGKKVLLAAILVCAQSLQGNQGLTQDMEFTDEFRIEERVFTTTGWNPYFILYPGFTKMLRGEEDGEPVSTRITVLDDIEVVDDVETRVVEEYHTANGMLEEISRNFFAICQETNDVFYFGEDVDYFDENGDIIGHDGSWRAGVNGARPGIFMPGTILLGSRYFQEIAPGVAMDQAEHIRYTSVVSSPLGEFKDCIEILETTPLNPEDVSYKRYAPGIGRVEDGSEIIVEMSGMPDLIDFEPIIQDSDYTEHFMLEHCEFSTTGRNPYFILEPGYQIELQGKDEEEEIVVIITVLHETVIIDGIMTRIVEEREFQNGVIAEISRNFFAICERTNSVFYFGEDVDNFDELGNFVDHASQWRAGVDGARPGLFLAGTPLLGSLYYQEIAPEIALDRGEDTSLDETVVTPAGIFEDCLLVVETTPLEPDIESTKIYAPGVGLVVDDQLSVTKFGNTSAVSNWELMR